MQLAAPTVVLTNPFITVQVHSSRGGPQCQGNSYKEIRLGSSTYDIFINARTRTAEHLNTHFKRRSPNCFLLRGPWDLLRFYPIKIPSAKKSASVSFDPLFAQVRFLAAQKNPHVRQALLSNARTDSKLQAGLTPAITRRTY